MNDDNLLIRIKKYNTEKKSEKNKHVLYWVQRGLRIDYNYSLKLAIDEANSFNLPLLVFFSLKEIKNANWRQYQFLKQGILELKEKLENLGANFFLKKVDSFLDDLKILDDASLVIVDFGYLRSQRSFINFLIKKISTPVYVVENNTFFPINLLSDKKVNFAFQIRKKIFELIPYFLKKFSISEVKNKEKIINQSIDDIEKQFNLLKFKDKVLPSKFIGGESQADKYLKEFIEEKLSFYKQFRSDPGKDYQSNLSPYLHFGFISPVKIVYGISKHYSLKDENFISFLNELLVWRELSHNFVYYEENYDNWKNLPKWSITSLDKHALDKRDYVYDLEHLEKGLTHDKYWNACQKEMILTGKMHNYMRMYWAKKVIEWSLDWKKAYQWLVYLNDKYELDGRDPNGYAGIAWSFGQFDHPWGERKIFGMVRYMNEKGLERKFDMQVYLQKIESLNKNS